MLCPIKTFQQLQRISRQHCGKNCKRASLLPLKSLVQIDFGKLPDALQRSEELVYASAIEAAEGLAALNMHRSDLRDRWKKELVKAAKKAVRDVILWRCTGCALGLDSREAMVRAFEDVCHHTACDENTISQLTNGYHRISGKPVAATASTQTDPEEAPVAVHEPVWATAFDEQPMYIFGLSFDGPTEQFSQT